MKLIQLGIASIVDSNTGHGLLHAGGRVDYSRAENDAHYIRARSVTALVQRAGDTIATVLRTLGERREHKRGVQRLAGLSDHLLGDIGFSRADINAAQTGRIDREQLAAGRRQSKRPQLGEVLTVSHNALSDNATNEAMYARANCA